MIITSQPSDEVQELNNYVITSSTATMPGADKNIENIEEGDKGKFELPLVSNCAFSTPRPHARGA